LNLAITAEESEFTSFLVWDHYLMPQSTETMDAFMLLSSIAHSTELLKLGTCVTPLPFRPPAQLAKIVATLDQISNGRVILGVGAGWHRAEFDAYSQWAGSTERVAKTKEALQLILKLWREKKVSFKGKYYSEIGAILEPKPVQKPNPQLWFGTTGSRMLKLAVKFGDGWIPTMLSPKEYGEVRKAIAQNLLGERPGARFTWALQDLNPEESAARFIKKIESYASAGCQHYAIAWTYNRGAMIERLKWFSREVIPSFR
jgi:alkanesulfonate monooxygenase SsuD/methylene tetrahydromethanopterin reductase-like flavin-dependent oxidoreductase (luciferase family)